MKSAIFFERDGILNSVKVKRQQQVSPLSLEEFTIRREMVPLMTKLKAAGFILLATTNQPGLSSGELNRREMDRMHEVLRRVFPLDDIMVCPHDENDHCPCRKPRHGLLTEAAFTWHLNLDHCFVVSDKWQDAEAAMNAGCTSLLLKSPWNGDSHHDFILPSLSDITKKILALRAPHHDPIAPVVRFA